MEIPDKRPLLLDGAVATNLMPLGMPEGGINALRWILQNSDRVMALTDAFIRAGAMAVLAPTYGVMRSAVAEGGASDDIAALNRSLAGMTFTAANGRVPVGGSVSPSGIEIKPFGEATFGRLIADYKEQMAALCESGLNFVLLEGFTNLVDLRAAILAARASQLPVFACVTVSDDCRTKTWDVDLLAALTVAQSLGVKAFGVNCSSPEAALSAVKRMHPYAEVPLIARPDAGSANPILPHLYDYSPESMAALTSELLAAGARIIGGCCGTTPEHIEAMAQAFQAFDPEGVNAKVNSEETIVANHSDAFFVSDSFTPSEGLDCALDMSEALLEAADAGFDAIKVNIKSPDDANLLAMNAHMASLPVMLKSDDEALLEAALLQYQGRALVDSQCYIPEQTLISITKRYGAVIY